MRPCNVCSGSVCTCAHGPTRDMARGSMPRGEFPAFWMVLADHSTQTRVRHKYAVEAKREAERLAAANPGVTFFVLQCIGAAVVEKPVKWMDADSVPF